MLNNEKERKIEQIRRYKFMKKRFLVLCSMTLFLLSAYSSTSFADQKAGESKTYTVDDINNGFTNYLV